MTIVLRDYQATDIERIRGELRNGSKAPLYQLSTGGGKTIVFCNIILRAQAKGTRTLVACHRRELILQASRKLTEAGVSHGIIAADLDRDHGEQVIVASIQTLARRLDTLPKFGLIVLDEAHHAVASTWRKLIESQPQAKLLGVTATPARLDGKGLGVKAGGFFDALTCGPSMQALVDAGHLAPCRVLVPHGRIDVRGIRTIAGDYDEKELAKRASGVTGNAVEEFRRLPAGTTALCFCVTVKHAEMVAAEFRNAGFRAQAISGETPKAERDAAIANLGTGEVQVLASCEIISEGLDVPSVGAVILLRPTKSLVMALQQIGRGMRPAPGKVLVVLDHAGNCITHGLPTDERTWSLDGIDKDAEAKKPSPWECLGCHTLNPANRRECKECGLPRPWACKSCGRRNPQTYDRCENCGAKKPEPRRILQADDARMTEMRSDMFARVARMSYRTLTSRPRSQAELQAYASAHGYKPGWVYYRLRDQEEKFGGRP